MSFSLREPVPTAPASTPVEWEETPCLLCAGQQLKPLVEAPEPHPDGPRQWFLVVQCQDCGLCFTNPRPSARAMDRFYSSQYAPHQPFDSPRKVHQRWWHRRPKADPRKILPPEGDGRLLDFGCGSGSYLARMHQQGWKVVGIDNNLDAVQHVRSHLNLTALAGTLPHPDLEEARFDVITMWQALEHVHRPLETLKAAYRLLVRGGRLIVTVPNIDSLAFRIFGQAWTGLDLPRHLSHFDPSSLRLMLQLAGFQTGEVEMVRRSGWLRDSAQNALQHFPNPPRSFRLLKRRVPAHLLGWYASWSRQSDCILISGRK